MGMRIDREQLRAPCRKRLERACSVRAMEQHAACMRAHLQSICVNCTRRDCDTRSLCVSTYAGACVQRRGAREGREGAALAAAGGMMGGGRPAAEGGGGGAEQCFVFIL